MYGDTRGTWLEYIVSQSTMNFSLAMAVTVTVTHDLAWLGVPILDFDGLNRCICTQVWKYVYVFMYTYMDVCIWELFDKLDMFALNVFLLTSTSASAIVYAYNARHKHQQNTYIRKAWATWYAMRAWLDHLLHSYSLSSMHACVHSSIFPKKRRHYTQHKHVCTYRRRHHGNVCEHTCAPFWYRPLL